METPIVSIIVPVYKAEAYLSRCVDSLLSQSYEDFEILLIDDGSTDRSGEMCDEYASADSRVRTFHKANGGVASARQLGHDMARGEYIIHSDPDDWVEPDMLECMLSAAKKADADVVIANHIEHYSASRSRTVENKFSSLAPEDILHGLLRSEIHGALWNKLIRKASLEKYDIRFLTGVSYSEDFYICCRLMQHSELVVVTVDKAFYHYVMYSNPHSIVRNITPQLLIDYQKVIQGVLECLDDEQFGEDKLFQYARLQHVAFLSKCTRTDYYQIVSLVDRKLMCEYVGKINILPVMKKMERFAIKGWLGTARVVITLYAGVSKLIRSLMGN